MTNKFSTILCCVFSALLANVSLSCDSVTVSSLPSLPSLPWLTMFNEPDQMPAVITVTRASSHSTKWRTSKIFLRNIKDFWCLLLYKLSSFSGLNFVINSLVIVVEDIWYFHSLSSVRDVWRLTVWSDCLDKCINFPIPDTPRFVSSHFPDFPIPVISVTFYHL